MGSGVFSLDTYNQAKKARAAKGQADFDYTNKMRNLAPSERKASKVLDVFGVKLREARDSDEHPNSTPVAVLFDVTGSMGSVPITLQKKLGELFNILETSPDVADPQLLVGAIGDDEYDRVPIQIGQFESDNRVDEQLREIYIEGGGGGDKREAYALAAHFMGTKVETDAWQKRQKKGYLFIIGDEMNKQALFADSIRKWLGDKADEDIAIERVYEVLKENGMSTTSSPISLPTTMIPRSRTTGNLWWGRDSRSSPILMESQSSSVRQWPPMSGRSTVALRFSQKLFEIA